SSAMIVRLRYGRGELRVDVPSARVSVIEPAFVPGLPDEAAAFREAVRRPAAARPLRDSILAGESLAVAIPDITRPLPSHRLLPWLFEELAHVPAGRVTIVNGTGSHRVNTDEELRSMVGAGILGRYRVVNHSAHEAAGLALAGRSPEGHPVYLNREWVEADRRIVLGFIEPHFMAGFSGGYKGVFPALADIDAIMRYHRAEVIADPRSTWGCLEGNPTQDQIRANGSLRPVDFCVNVTLNRDGAITGFFCGDPLEAHRAGCAFARSTAMVPQPHAFPIVVTTNSGYPLDQNLYQAVKGMSAAAQIVEPGGLILAAARCDDGFPAHGHFRRLMTDPPSARAILDMIAAPGFSVYDQWEAQILAMILVKARVGLFSELPSAAVGAAHLEPVDDLADRLREELSRVGDVPVAVLPEGPMTIPYLAGA
ncbi:MAG TPA: nickel-dependent lactate racemase, partial [Vicinamibacterales bacterium]|nr:nickel-dependent lactate racemase [Vicinamibacterales bacterium]